MVKETKLINKQNEISNISNINNINNNTTETVTKFRSKVFG